jgi:hypothetical protein
MPPGSIVRAPADSLVSNNTCKVYGPPITSCDCAPMIDKLSICGFMSSVIVPGLLKATL